MMEEKCLSDRDRQMDPLQRAHAYRKALQQTGNPLSRVEIFPMANHGIAVSGTGCPDQAMARVIRAIPGVRVVERSASSNVEGSI
jgi:hypothetical protein